jgi:hypothetical protein
MNFSLDPDATLGVALQDPFGVVTNPSRYRQRTDHIGAADDRTALNKREGQGRQQAEERFHSALT